MKKILFLFLAAIILVPVVFAKDNVSIESYELVKSSDTTTELSKPKVDGLNISFDLSFGTLKDYAKYKIVIENKTTNDYEINKTSDFNKSEYITYEYEFENNSNVAPAKSKITMYITITYTDAVPIAMLNNGKFTESNKMAISLSTNTSSASMKETEEKNPNTSSSILIICVLGLTIALLCLILFGKTKRTRYITTCFLSLLLIPTTIFALEKLQINVETKITVEEKYKLSIIKRTLIKESEASNYILESTLYNVPDEDYCDTDIYLINGERYIICSIVEESIHPYGERINIPVVKQTVVDKWGWGEDGPYRYCEEDEVYTYTCTEEALKEQEFEYLDYSEDYNSSIRDDDFNTMNIQGADRANWDIDRFIIIDMPNQLTMPRHDVYLKAMYHSH